MSIGARKPALSTFVAPPSVICEYVRKRLRDKKKYSQEKLVVQTLHIAYILAKYLQAQPCQLSRAVIIGVGGKVRLSMGVRRAALCMSAADGSAALATRSERSLWGFEGWVA